MSWEWGKMGEWGGGGVVVWGGVGGAATVLLDPMVFN